MLKVKIGRNGVELYQEGGLNVSFVKDTLNVVAESITVEFEEGSPAFAIQFDNLRPARQRLPASSPRRGSSTKQKKVADYIEDVFREHDRPMGTSDLADLVRRAGFETDSESFPYTIRTAMARDTDRFMQYDTFTWGLKALTPKWEREGKLTGPNEGRLIPFDPNSSAKEPETSSSKSSNDNELEDDLPDDFWDDVVVEDPAT